MYRFLCCALTTVLFTWLESAAFARQWVDVTGQFTVEADLIDVRDGNVQLRRQDGSVISVPLDRLSEADRRFLASRQATSAAKTALVTLVKDGQPVSVIVTRARAGESESLAAAELQEHIRIMSGATLPIVIETELRPDPSKAVVVIGRCELARQHGIDTSEFAPESFVVKTAKNVLLLVGDDSGSKSSARTGSLYAVYDFLQDQLGCRWIWPGEIGRVAPRRATVAVGALDIHETPTIKIRDIRMTIQEKHKIGYEQEGLGAYFDFGETYDRLSEDESTWLRRMRMGRSFKLSAGHAFTDWWEKYKDTDREIFALQPNGRRGPRRSDQPDFVKMCVSNPNLWDLQLEPLRKYARQGATGLSVNSCENDGSGGFCVCPQCRAWDANPNSALDSLPAVEDGSDVDAGGDDASDLPESLSDRYARWYNELAKRAREADPESRVVAYAYSRYRSPPTKLDRIEPNVWIGYVGFNAYPRNEEHRKMSVDEWFGWSRLGATVFLRSNSLFYCGEGAPCVVSHQLAEDLQFQVKNGLQATDYDCLQGYWATTGPGYYVLARMLWDTDADPDQILAEFYESFGPMEAVVKEYFDFWEAFTTDLGNHPEFSELNRTERLQAYPKVYGKASFAKAERILDEARPLLPKASDEQRERFQNIVLGLKHGVLLVEALADGKTSNGPQGKALMAFRREIAPRNVVNVYWTTSKEKRYRVFE